MQACVVLMSIWSENVELVHKCYYYYCYWMRQRADAESGLWVIGTAAKEKWGGCFRKNQCEPRAMTQEVLERKIENRRKDREDPGRTNESGKEKESKWVKERIRKRINNQVFKWESGRGQCLVRCRADRYGDRNTKANIAGGKWIQNRAWIWLYTEVWIWTRINR